MKISFGSELQVRTLARIATSIFGAVVVVCGLSYPAQASISTYSNLASWQAANPTSTLENFNSLPANTLYSPYSTAADGTIQALESTNGGSLNNAGVITYSATNFGTGQYLIEDAETYYQSYSYSAGTYYYDCGFGCDTETLSASGGTDTEEAPITLTPPANTTALGFEVGQVSDYDNQSRNITATITTADNETQQLTINNAAGTLSFFGFSASDPITSVTLLVALNPIEDYYQSAGYTTEENDSYYYYDTASYSYIDYSQLAFDNLMYGVPPPTAVPEPSSWILALSTACMALAVVGRKRIRFFRKTM